ncbi:MAG: hypothetical protein ACFFFH_03750 [Candidatus Thorarchaeota archaeon]
MISVIQRKQLLIIVSVSFLLFLFTLLLFLPFSSHPLSYQAPPSYPHPKGPPGVNGNEPERDVAFENPFETATHRFGIVWQTGVRTVTYSDTEIELIGPERILLPLAGQSEYVQSHDLVIEKIIAYEPLVFLNSHLGYTHTFLKNPCLVIFTPSICLSPESSPAKLVGEQSWERYNGGGYSISVSNGVNTTIYFSTSYLFVHGSVTYFNGEMRYYEVAVLRTLDLFNIYPIDNITDGNLDLNSNEYIIDNSGEPILYYELINSWSVSNGETFTVVLNITDDSLKSNSFIFHPRIEVKTYSDYYGVPFIHEFNGSIDQEFYLRLDNFLSLNIVIP